MSKRGKMPSLRRVLGLTTVMLLVVTLQGAGTPASATPATTIAYAAQASATRFTGLAFDACDAPATATMRAWKASRSGASGSISADRTAPADRRTSAPGGWRRSRGWVGD